jgi:hypothetical protein
VSPAKPPGAWARWVALWDRREPGTSLALFRVALALCTLYSVGAVVADGALPVIWLGPGAGGYTTPAEPWQFRLLGGVTPATVWTMTALCLGSGLLLVVGLGGRLTALVVLQSYLALTRLNPAAAGAYDWFLTNGLWLLVLARSTATLSLDCRLRTGRWTSPVPVPAWPRYLAVFQLVLVYWSTGMHKLSPSWTPLEGCSALYYILQQPSWQRCGMEWLAWVYPLTQVGTAVTWLWEVTSPLLLLALWYRHTRERPGRLRALFNAVRYRELFVAVGVVMHLGVFVLMEVGPFSWVSLAFYACLFGPAEWEAAGRRLAWWRRAGPVSAVPGTTI